MTRDNICASIDDFFLCTHLPMKAFEFDGTLIHTTGYSEPLEELFQENNIFKIAKEELLNRGKNPYITVSCLEGINFIAFNICNCNVKYGFFVCGPYKTDTRFTEIEIVYKPLNCIPHIVSLFHNIRNSNYPLALQEVSQDSYSSYTEKAVDYIKNNYHKSITLDDISEHVKINRCYLCNVFKKETGKTYSKFLNDIRIEKSKELLLDRTLSILEVSLSVGFNNQNYFNMVFKKLTNMTPLEYRNNNIVR